MILPDPSNVFVAAPPTTLTHMDAFIAQLQLLLLLHFQLLKSCFRSSQEKNCSSSIFHHFTIKVHHVWISFTISSPFSLKFVLPFVSPFASPFVSPCFHHVMPRCFTISPSSKCSSRSSSATWRSAAWNALGAFEKNGMYHKKKHKIPCFIILNCHSMGNMCIYIYIFIPMFRCSDSDTCLGLFGISVVQKWIGTCSSKCSAKNAKQAPQLQRACFSQSVIGCLPSSSVCIYI